MRIRCDVHVMEVNGREADDVALIVKNYVREQDGGDTLRRGLVVVEIDGSEYLVEAQDLRDAVTNAGLNAGMLG